MKHAELPEQLFDGISKEVLKHFFYAICRIYLLMFGLFLGFPNPADAQGLIGAPSVEECEKLEIKYRRELKLPQKLREKKRSDDDVFMELGDSLYGQSKFLQAVGAYKCALKVREQNIHNTRDYAKLSKTFWEIGYAYDMDGYKWPDCKRQAVSWFQRCIEAQEIALGKNSDEQGLTLEIVAGICLELGDWGAARDYYLREIQILEKTRGPSETGFALMSLGIAYKNLWQFREAESCFKKASRIYLSKRSDQNDGWLWRTDEPGIELEKLYFCTGQWSQAKAIFQTTQASAEKSSGFDSYNNFVEYNIVNICDDICKPVQKLFDESLLRLRLTAYFLTHKQVSCLD